MRVVLKVHRKGIIVLPKRLREALGINEGDEVIAEVVGDKLVLRALKPKVVDIDPRIVEEILQEEYSLERNRYARMISSGEACSRH
jgi:antitoxin MazE